MRVVVQRVKEGAVEIENKEVGRISQGLVILLGVGQDDVEKDAEYLAEKIIIYEYLKIKKGK